MADQNPTAGPRVVPVHLSDAQARILRSDMLGWLAGIDRDLARFPGRLRHPEAAFRESEAIRRLLAALDAHGIELPDEDARATLTRAADGFDHASGYMEIAAVHDAHHALLAILDTVGVAR